MPAETDSDFAGPWARTAALRAKNLKPGCPGSPKGATRKGTFFSVPEGKGKHDYTGSRYSNPPRGQVQQECGPPRTRQRKDPCCGVWRAGAFCGRGSRDRKSTRLNSSHVKISYA